MATTKKTTKPASKKPVTKKTGQPKDGQLAAFAQQHAGVRLLGEVVSWSSGTQTHKHQNVVAALQAASLNEKVARELLPRHAFSRACKKLSDNRVIDVVQDDHDTIRFQFTQRYIEEGAGEKEWQYKKECYLALDKQMGRVSCTANKELEQHAQNLLDAAMEERTTADISKMIQRLFDAEADLFPIREQGGVYFVPDRFAAFTDKVESFLRGLGGRVSRFPVPADTRQGDQSVQDAILNGLAGVIHDHEEAVAAFGTDTRPDTLDRAAKKIRDTRTKIEAYAEYLKDKQAELLEAVELANTHLTNKVKMLTEQRAANPTTETEGGTRGYIFGYSVTAVIRWCGKNGWSFKQTRRAVDHYTGGGKISDATIRAQLLGGRQPDMPRGEPAPLNEEQVAELVAKQDEAAAAAAGH